MTTKHILIFPVIALISIGAFLQFVPPSNRRYCAQSGIIVRPYTNVLFALQFQAGVIRTVPHILRVEVSPGFSIPNPSATTPTNSAAIRILAFGSTPQQALQAAHDSADQLCQIVATNYGVSAQIFMMDKSARGYSYFHDTLQPRVISLFRH